jgi:calcineurin-like phosphoesterase family protein
MNREIRIRETEDRKVYVTTDSHLGHCQGRAMDFVIRKRGFTNKDDHDNAVIDSYNATARPSDILIHLGDVCLNTDESQLNEYLARIACQNIFVLWGNHNNPLWTIYKRQVNEFLKSHSSPDAFNVFDEHVEIYPFQYKNVTFMGNYLEAQINGMKFVMCHYPIYVFNEMKHGTKHLCGHSHYSLPLSTENDLTSKILDVGWDGHRKPLSIDEICGIMNKKGLLKVDHHQRDH